MNNSIKQFNQDDLVRIISSNTSLNMRDVREVLEELEQVIIKEALLTTKDTSLKIKLFKGFYITAKYSDGLAYIKGATKGNAISPAPKIKLYISDTFKNKLKKMYSEK